MGTNRKSSFVKQAAILASAGLIARLLGFLYRLPLTDMIGDSGNGIYGAGYYIYTFFLILSSAGLPVAISKMISERLSFNEYRNAHRVFQVSLRASALIGFICSLVMWFFAVDIANAIDSPNSYHVLLTLSPTIFIVSIMSVYRGYFQGMGNTTPTAVSQIIEQIFNAIFSVVLAYLFLGKGLKYAAAGGTAGTGVGAVVGFLTLVFVYRLARPMIIRKMRTDKTRAKELESTGSILFELFSTAFPIIVGTAIFSFTNLIDMKMVMGILQDSNYSLEEAEKLYGMLTGKYATLVTLPVAISTAFATAAMPNIAASFVRKEKDTVQRKINLALRLTMIISIPAAVGMGVLSDQILLLLFPKNPEGGTLLLIGSVSIIFLALAQITTGILQGIGRIYVPAVAAFLGAFIKIPLNYFLISNTKINVNGAVISTMVCYFTASAIDLFVLKHSAKIKLDFINIIIKPVFSATIMGVSAYVFYYAVYYALPSNTLAMIVAIFVGFCVYFSFMIMFKGIKKEDLLLMPLGNKLVTIIYD